MARAYRLVTWARARIEEVETAVYPVIALGNRKRAGRGETVPVTYLGATRAVSVEGKGADLLEALAREGKVLGVARQTVAGLLRDVPEMAGLLPPVEGRAGVYRLAEAMRARIHSDA